MASMLTAADRELVATLDKDDAKRLDLKSPGDVYYKANEIFHAAADAMGTLNPFVGSVAFGATGTTSAVTFVDEDGKAAPRANATYQVITSLEPTAGAPDSKFAFAASKTTTGFTMTINAACGTDKAMNVPFIVVG